MPAAFVRTRIGWTLGPGNQSPTLSWRDLLASRFAIFNRMLVFIWSGQGATGGDFELPSIRPKSCRTRPETTATRGRCGSVWNSRRHVSAPASDGLGDGSRPLPSRNRGIAARATLVARDRVSRTTRWPVMSDASLIARRICVQGIVQGVGFRPFVFRLAERYGVSGGY